MLRTVLEGAGDASLAHPDVSVKREPVDQPPKGTPSKGVPAGVLEDVLGQVGCPGAEGMSSHSLYFQVLSTVIRCSRNAYGFCTFHHTHR